MNLMTKGVSGRDTAYLKSLTPWSLKCTANMIQDNKLHGQGTCAEYRDNL